MKLAIATRDYNFVIGGLIVKSFKKTKTYIMSNMLLKDIMSAGGSNLFSSVRELEGANLYKKYKGENLDGKKICIWRTGGMGDLCWLTPYFKKIKELYPTSKIVFGCGVQYSDVMSVHPLIDEFHCLPIDTDVLLQCDYHLMFEGIVENNPDASHKNCYDLFGEYFSIKLEDDEKIPNLPVLEGNKKYFEEVNNKFITIEDPIKIGIHLKTSSMVRNVPPALWTKLVYALLELHPKICVYLLGSQEDADVGNQIPFLESSKGRILPFFQVTRGFLDTVASISQMDLVLGPDSSALHIAAAFSKPMIGFYGAFKSELRMKYYKNAIGKQSQIKCSPCFLHGNDSCDNSDMENNSYCMMLFEHDMMSIMEDVMMLLTINHKMELNYITKSVKKSVLKIYEEAFGEAPHE